MNNQLVKNVVVLGGGTSGWMTATAIQRFMNRVSPGRVRVTVVEGPDGPIGVGEATVPTLLGMLSVLGADEREFMIRSNATFKQGIKFVNWLHDPAQRPSSYFHLFQRPGVVEGMDYGQYWLDAHPDAPPEAYAESVVYQAALCHASRAPKAQNSKQYDGLAGYAYHLDAILFGRYLRDLATRYGAQRVEARVTGANLDERGYIRSLSLEGGHELAGDLFIDCSGFQGYLINQVLGEPFEPWGDHLFCDRAVAMQVPFNPGQKINPFTLSTALSSGWAWEIHLLSRRGTGYVYSSQHISDEDAERELRQYVGPAAEKINARKLHMRVGRCRRFWVKNCVAIGLAGGFLEPLESTSISLIQMGIDKLVHFWPDTHMAPELAAEYNRLSIQEFERIRDFIILHYKATERNDSPMWDYCRNMPIPETLQRKIDLFRVNGRIFRDNEELFAEESWLQVMIGQHIVPRSYDPLVDMLSPDLIARYLGDIEKVIGRCVDIMPLHREFIASHCAAGTG